MVNICASVTIDFVNTVLTTYYKLTSKASDEEVSNNFLRQVKLSLFTF